MLQGQASAGRLYVILRPRHTHALHSVWHACAHLKQVVILETSEKGSTVVVAAMFTPRVSDMIKSTQDRASELPSLLQREAEQLTGSKYSSSILKAVDAEGDTLLINWKDGSSVKDWFVDTPGVASLVLEVERVGE